MTDILFKADQYVFSYRVAGIFIRNGCVLLQRFGGDPGYAFPGGHVELGETNEETLIREFKEEIGWDIRVRELKWVAEIFFSWGNKPCHQICLYYMIEAADETKMPKGERFSAHEQIEGKGFELEFSWIPLDRIDDLLIYPDNAKSLLSCLELGVQHFVCRDL